MMEITQTVQKYPNRWRFLHATRNTLVDLGDTLGESGTCWLPRSWETRNRLSAPSHAHSLPRLLHMAQATEATEQHSSPRTTQTSCEGPDQ